MTIMSGRIQTVYLKRRREVINNTEEYEDSFLSEDTNIQTSSDHFNKKGPSKMSIEDYFGRSQQIQRHTINSLDLQKEENKSEHKKLNSSFNEFSNRKPKESKRDFLSSRIFSFFKKIHFFGFDCS